MDNEFKVLESLIYATIQRHKVLVSNIANTDTPDYRAKDVDFRSLFDNERLRLVTTDGRHIRPEAGGGPGPIEVREVEGGPWGDRNDVELDTELAKMTENGLLNQVAMRLLSKEMGMYRNAMKR